MRIIDDYRARNRKLAGPRVLHRHRIEARHSDRVRDALEAACAGPHTLSTEHARQLQPISRMLQQLIDETDGDDDDRVERTLVEAIVTEYDSDAPRLVYADWLLSRGDARGAFINLDIQLASGERVKGKRDRYYKAHKHSILGPVAPLVSWNERFERGFLHSARFSTQRGVLDVPADQRDAMLGDLRWATLRSCQVSGTDDFTEVFRHAPLWSLRHVQRPSLTALLAFADRTRPVPLHSAAITARPDDSPGTWRALARLARPLPGLRELDVMIWGRQGDRVTPPLEFFRSPLVHTLHRISNGDTSTGGVARIDEWLQRMHTARCPVPRVRLLGPELSADIHRQTSGEYTIALTLDHLRHDRVPFDTVAHALRGIPARLVASMSVTWRTISDDASTALRAAMQHLPLT